MMKLKSVLPLLLSVILISCNKEPGPGGLASIKGRVYVYDLTAGLDTVSKGYIGDMRVFIGSADESVQFDDTRTSYDGSYEFKFLRKGNYKLWVIAESDTFSVTLPPLPDGQQYYMQDVEVKEKKEEVTVPDFTITI